MPRTATHYFCAEARSSREGRASHYVGAGPAEAEYKKLYDDYEQRQSIEARIVKAADVIDLLVQAYALERAGAKVLTSFGEVAGEADFQLPAIAQSVVREVMDSLMAERRKIT